MVVPLETPASDGREKVSFGFSAQRPQAGQLTNFTESGDMAREDLTD